MRTVLLMSFLSALFTSAALGCTGVVIARNGRVFVGGNEDWERLDSYMWVDAATSSTHGVVYLGYEIRGEWGYPYLFWYEFQGVNDAGLYFGSFGSPCATPTTTLGNPDRAIT